MPSGYHVYKDIWEAEINLELLCSPNREDRYAVAVMNDTNVFAPGCFEAASTVSLATLIVADGSVSDNGPSGSGRLFSNRL